MSKIHSEPDSREARFVAEIVNREQSVDTPVHLFLITGASGSGKTFLVEELQKLFGSYSSISFHFFDRIGVPSEEEMVREFGSGREWQRAKTIEWIGSLSENGIATIRILEGQFLPDYASEGLERYPCKSSLLVIDVNDEERTRRLVEDRQQPELAHEDMMNWGRVLRKRTLESGGKCIDTSTLSLAQMVEEFCSIAVDELTLLLNQESVD